MHAGLLEAIKIHGEESVHASLDEEGLTVG